MASFECPNCGKDTLRYKNANESECIECGHVEPNANLPTLKP